MLLLLAAFALAQVGPVSPVPGVKLLDEGSNQGQVTGLNFTGAGISCSKSGSTGTCNASGGGGGLTLTTVEIDFGVAARFTAKLEVTDAGVSATSKILAVQGGIAATGRQADENEMDAITCRAIPAAGSFTLICSCERSVTHGLFKVFYTVG